MTTQPAFTWQVVNAGGGTVSNTGLYTAPATGSGKFQVKVSAGGLSAPGHSHHREEGSGWSGWSGWSSRSGGSSRSQPVQPVHRIRPGRQIQPIRPVQPDRWRKRTSAQVPGFFLVPSGDAVIIDDVAKPNRP